MKLAFSSHPVLAVLAQAGHGQAGRLIAEAGDQTWSFCFQSGTARAIDTTHAKFVWAQFVEYVPGLADNDRKNLRQMLRFGGTSLQAALDELGLELTADTIMARTAEAIWARIFSDPAPRLHWQDAAPVKGSFELGLDRLYLIALSKQANPKKLRELALSLGNVELQAVEANKLGAMKLLGMEQATFSRLTAQSVEEALQEIPERDQNKVAALIVVAALLGVIEPLEEAVDDSPGEVTSDTATSLPAQSDDPASLAPSPWWERADVVSAFDMLGGTSNDSRRELTSLYQRGLKQLDEAHLPTREAQRNKRLLVAAFAIVTQDDLSALYMKVQREGLRGIRAIAEVQVRAGQAMVTEALKLARKGDFGAAYPLLLRVRNSAPDNADSAALLGLLTLSGHPAIEFDPVKGLEYIQTATDLDDQRAAFRYWEGVALEWLQQPLNARTAYTACLTLDPEHPAAQVRLEQLKL